MLQAHRASAASDSELRISRKRESPPLQRLIVLYTLMGHERSRKPPQRLANDFSGRSLRGTDLPPCGGTNTCLSPNHPVCGYLRVCPGFGAFRYSARPLAISFVRAFNAPD